METRQQSEQHICHFFRSTLVTACFFHSTLATAWRPFRLTSATTRLLSKADEEDDEDPFTELEEDEDELSENKIAMEDC